MAYKRTIIPHRIEQLAQQGRSINTKEAIDLLAAQMKKCNNKYYQTVLIYAFDTWRMKDNIQKAADRINNGNDPKHKFSTGKNLTYFLINDTPYLTEDECIRHTLSLIEEADETTSQVICYGISEMINPEEPLLFVKQALEDTKLH